MNQKPERVFKQNKFRQETLSFKDVPHQSKLFLDFQSNAPQIEKFYPEKSTSLKDFAAKVTNDYKIDRNTLCDILTETNKSFGAGNKTIENIETLREKDCVTIVTGQQAGLFTGAIYTIYKAASAIKLAGNLRQKNIKAVPVFWIAEEDHDFDEVKKTYFLDKENKLKKIENSPAEYTENSLVGLVKLDEKINKTIEDLFENLAHTEFTDEIKKLLSGCYQSGETYSTSFAKFLTKMFSDYGLIVLSPLNEKLKKLCAPIFVEAIEKSDEIIGALLQRNDELEAEKFQPQVLVAENSFPFFFQNENGARQALRRDLKNSKYKIQNEKKEFDQSELTEIAQNSPQKLSPNALLRPVVQDYLLPTLVYFGGAAEIAYFAQNAVIYKILNRPVTPIRHRASFTIIEAKHQRTFEKYGLAFTDLFKGEDKILARIVEKFINQKTAEIFAGVEENINGQLNSLEENLTNSEPTLAANLSNRRKKIIWHLEALRKKYHRAEILKNEIVQRRIENLFAALLPNNALQERTLNFVTFLNLYGANFIDWIFAATNTDEESHQILFL